MKFNRKDFYDSFRRWRGVVLPDQVKGLNFLLDSIERDPFITRKDWAAYMLATTMHETAFTFLPVHEYGSRNYFIQRYGGQTRKGRELGNDTPEEGYDYAGKGNVQLTGESNYERAEIALRREYPELVAKFERETGKRFDLTVGDQPGDKDDPKNAMHPEIAYAIMSYGMRTGLFTGKKLSDYFNRNFQDWKNARRIINGVDKAETIAAYAKHFYSILLQTEIKELTSENVGERIDQIKIPAAESLPEITPSNERVNDTPPEQNSIPPETEKKEILAPEKENSTAASTKLTILGFAVPAVLTGVVGGIKSAFEQGFIDGKQVFDLVLKFLMENTRYVFYLIGLIIVGMILKKLYKQISFFLTLWINADPKKADVEIVKQ